MRSLSDLLAPVPVEDFFASKWNCQSLLVRGSPDKTRNLFSWDEVNRIICQHRLAPPQIRLSQERKSSDELAFIKRRFSSTGNPIYHVDIPLLYSLLRDGASLVLDAVDEMSSAVTDLCENVGRDLSCQLSVNAYATWGTEPGFGLHWDDHDLFVVQIEGSKRWKLYKPTRKFPLSKDTMQNPVPTENDLVWDEIVHPGDVIYIPRGHWHNVLGVGIPTLHLTCGFSNPSGIDYLSWLVDKMREIEVVRRDIPRFAAKSDMSEYQHAIEFSLKQMAEKHDVREYIDYWKGNVQARVRASLPMAVSGIEDTEDFLIAISSVAATITELVDESKFELNTCGKSIILNQKAQFFVEQLIIGEKVRLSQLLSDSRNELTRPAALKVIEVLMLHAVVFISKY
jgi:ribosomal protein L16 Arg81 hydroxylase